MLFENIGENEYCFSSFEKDFQDRILTSVREVRLMIEDICPYSCSWCAVNGYKKELKGISKFDNKKYGYNEGAMVQNRQNVIGRTLSPEDYIFLISVFKNNFGTSDITLTGGEALLNKYYKEITQLLSSLGVEITVLTKGAPLFNSLELLDFTSRIIISLDTLSSEEYADLNLPLKDKNLALGYLEKTLNLIKKLLYHGKKITINSVIPPDGEESINKIYNLISFFVEVGVEDVKFLELDDKNITKPYLEEYFDILLKSGKLNHFEKLNDVSGDGIDRKKHILTLKTKNNKKLKISFCRTTCSQEHMYGLDFQGDKNYKKGCEFEKDSFLTINTTAEIIPCMGLPSKKLSIYDEIILRDYPGLIKKILNVKNIIQEQKCPI